jgi:MFS family permease
VLSALLVAVAFVAGVAGSWSPCGLSMVDTLAPEACGGRRRTSVVGALAFAGGALIGGVATFGGLAVLGDALGAGGGAAAAIAAACLVVAAAGDAGGRRIVPQVRRQVPESWRRVLPVPLAAALYGVLLGLGFTTFVLSFATWGLAAVCLAVGTPATGVLVGLAFGLGRAVPVGVLAPLQDRDPYAAAAAAMAERPLVLRGLRAGAAALLVAAAASLAVSPPAARAAAEQLAAPARDPSAADGLVAWQEDGHGILLRDGERFALPGTHPVVGGGYVAFVMDDLAVVSDSTTFETRFVYPVPLATGLAVSDTHLVWRAPDATGRDVIYAHDLAATEPVADVTVAAAKRGETLGRPVLDGTTVVYDVQSPAVSRIREYDLAARTGFTLRSATEALLLAPSMSDGRLMYVRSTATRQRVILGRTEVYSTTPTARRDRGYEPGHEPHRQGYPGRRRPDEPARPPAGVTVTLWSTAFDDDTAYVTRLRHRPGGRTESSILRVGL